MKRYKVRSAGELSQFTAAVRPSFDAWRDDFIERRPFTTGSTHLDEVLSETRGMITFQETLMTYFQWLGVTPAESIGLIKKISKKKIHTEDFEALENRLREKWVENTGSMEHFDTTWQMVQGCMSYGFAAPHALATAIDSLYGAWLKVNYPLEYYTTVFGYYEGDMERTNKLTEELNYFGIKLKSVQFGRSSGKYQINREENAIYKSIGSIKYNNSEIGDKLYEMRDTQFDSFIDFLNVSPLNSRQLDILVKLDFFKEQFGKSLKLLKIIDLYNMLHGKKQIKKEKTTLPMEVLSQYCIAETEKMFKFDDEHMDAMLADLCNRIPDESIPLQTKLKTEQEMLGYISHTDPSRPNSAVVMNLDCKYSPKANLYLLATGQTISAKIAKKIYQNSPFCVGDILNYRSEQRPKWKKVNDEWVQDASAGYDTWLTSYTID